MPTSSKKKRTSKVVKPASATKTTKIAKPSKGSSKQSWFKQWKAWIASRPHRSFRLSRRSEYRQPLELPGLLLFTFEVVQTVWQYRRIFSLLTIIFVTLYVVLIGVQSQDTYTNVTTAIYDAGQSVAGEDWGVVQQVGSVFLATLTLGVGNELSESQQVYALLIGLLIWLTTVWMLRNLLAGHAVRLRDGLFNAGTPLFAMFVIVGIIAIQLLPVGIAALGYSAASASGLLAGGVEAMLFWFAAAGLVLLSAYWISASIFALILITVPGMYPLQAMRAAGQLLYSRRLKIMLRWLWMVLTILALWFVMIVPVILIDIWLKSVWPSIEWLPLVPFALVLVAAFSVVWSSAYSYLLYRKVVEYVPQK